MTYYEYVQEDDVEKKLFSEQEEYGEYLDTVDTNMKRINDHYLNTKAIDNALGTQNIAIKYWYFEPGDRVIYHAHMTQEEVFYIMKGKFSLKLGPSGDTEMVEVGPGTWYSAGPRMGHSHKNIGDQKGVVLSLGAPYVQDRGRNPHKIHHSLIKSFDEEFEVDKKDA